MVAIMVHGATGTHDNETAAGWWKDSAGAQDREFLTAYLGSDGRDVAWDLIRAAYASVSRTTIVMMQVPHVGHYTVLSYTCFTSCHVFVVQCCPVLCIRTLVSCTSPIAVMPLV